MTNLDAPRPTDDRHPPTVRSDGTMPPLAVTVPSPQAGDSGFGTLSRRRALQAAAGLSTAGLAGCLNGPLNPPGDSNQGTFESVAVDGLTLVVTLTGSATVDQVNVIAPTGQLFAKQSVATGVRKVSFDIGTDYPPGEFSILAIHQEETVAETTHAIRPDWRITEFGLGANHPEEMPDDMSQAKVDDEAFMTVTNRGSGPDFIKQLLVLGDVPNPTTKLADSELSGIYGTSKPVVVKSNNNQRIYTDSIPFRFLRNGNITCQPESQSGTFELVLVTSIAGRTTMQYEVRYTGAEKFDGCKITVQGNSQ